MEIIENSRVNELNRLGISNREKVDNHIKQHENVFTTSKTSKPHVFKKKKKDTFIVHPSILWVWGEGAYFPVHG